MLRTALSALTLGGVALFSVAPATAGDFGISVGFGYPDYGHYRPATRFYHSEPLPLPARRKVVVKQLIEEDDDEEECRIIIKKRYNRFGDLVVRRVRICD